MQSKYYRIINKVLEIRQEQEREIPLFYGFGTEKPGKADLVIEFWEKERNFHPWYGVEYYTAREEYPHLFISHCEPGVRMLADADYGHLIIEGVKKGLRGAMELLLAGFYSWLCKSGGLLVHASLIEYQGEALLFAAASGVGKTTQAELWKSCKGADILNGDKAMLEESKEGWITAWGSPWRGSSPYALNRCANLKGIILPEQAEENKICRLTQKESMELLLPHVFYPFWDSVCVAGMMAVLGNALEKIPVYKLLCKADGEAVEVTYQAVWEWK